MKWSGFGLWLDRIGSDLVCWLGPGLIWRIYIHVNAKADGQRLADQLVAPRPRPRQATQSGTTEPQTLSVGIKIGFGICRLLKKAEIDSLFSLIGEHPPLFCFVEVSQFESQQFDISIRRGGWFCNLKGCFSIVRHVSLILWLACNTMKTMKMVKNEIVASADVSVCF